MVNESQAIQLSDALRWLYTELEHIRRIHLVLTVLASLAILICAVARSSGGVYEDLQKLSYYVDHSAVAWRDILADNIKIYRPDWVPEDHEPFFESIPQEEVVMVVEEAQRTTRSRSLEELREKYEQVGVKVRLISKVIIDDASIKGYREWETKSQESKKKFIPLVLSEVANARITMWPAGEEPGTIEYTARSGDYSYRGSGMFHTRGETWSAPDDWFKSTFPSLERKWGEYAQLNMDDAAKKAAKDLWKDVPNISLSLGVQVPKENTVVAFPLLILLSLIVLAVQVSYVAEFAIFCQKTWPTPACFLAPWIGGQLWPKCELIKVLLFDCTILVIPVVAVGWLSIKFHIYGYWGSLFVGAIFAIIYYVLYRPIKRGAACIDKLNFLNESSRAPS